MIIFTLITDTDAGNTVRRCHESEVGYVGWSSTHTKKWNAQWTGSQISLFNKNKCYEPLICHFFLHIAILHNKYQIINRALDAFLWYCEPKHHTRAFALPVVQ